MEFRNQSMYVNVCTVEPGIRPHPGQVLHHRVASLQCFVRPCVTLCPSWAAAEALRTGAVGRCHLSVLVSSQSREITASLQLICSQKSPAMIWTCQTIPHLPTAAWLSQIPGTTGSDSEKTKDECREPSLPSSLCSQARYRGPSHAH